MVAESVYVFCKLGYSAKHRNYLYFTMTFKPVDEKGELLVGPAWIRDFI